MAIGMSRNIPDEAARPHVDSKPDRYPVLNAVNAQTVRLAWNHRQPLSANRTQQNGASENSPPSRTIQHTDLTTIHEV